MVINANAQMKRGILLIVIAFALTISIVSAAYDSTYQDCSVYGNCQPAKQVIQFNNNTGFVNDSNFFRGYTPDSLPLSAAFKSNVSVSFVPYTGASKNVNLGVYNLTTTGRIGVGTAPNAGYSLTTQNGILINSGSLAVTSGPVLISQSASVAQIRPWGGSQNVLLSDFGGNGVTVRNGGYVGINSTSPSLPLDVAGEAIFGLTDARTITGIDVFSEGIKANPTYRLLFYLPNTTGTNRAHMTLQGQIGGWTATQGKAYVTLSLATRDSENFVGTYIGDLGNSDIKIYKEADNSYSVWGYFGGTGQYTTRWSLTASGNIAVGASSHASYPVYAGASTSETTTAPTGTLVWSLSNNSQQMVSSAGLVGIGTVTPSNKLDILSTENNHLRLSYNTTNYGSLYVDNYGSMFITTAEPADIRIRPSGSLYLGDSSTDAIFMGRSDTNLITTIRGRLNVSNSTGSIGLFQTTSANVGVGTNNPSAKLVVQPSTRSTYAIRIEDNDSTLAGGIYLGSTGAGTFELFDANSNMSVQLSPTAGTFFKEGTFGIGLPSAPTNKLEVNGSKSKLVFDVDSIASTSIIKDGYDNVLRLQGYTIDFYNYLGVKVMQIGSNNDTYILNKLGIGNSTPLYPLHVATNVSGVSAYFATNISTGGIILHSKSYDKSKGAARDHIKDASAYINPDGSFNHSAETYAGVSYVVNGTIVKGYSVEDKLRILEQALYETITRLDNVCSQNPQLQGCEE